MSEAREAVSKSATLNNVNSADRFSDQIGANCKVETFIDRDLELIRCLEDRVCSYKSGYSGRLICTCPALKQRSH